MIKRQLFGWVPARSATFRVREIPPFPVATGPLPSRISSDGRPSKAG